MPCLFAASRNVLLNRLIPLPSGS